MIEIAEFPKWTKLDVSHLSVITQALDEQGIRAAEFSIYYLLSWYYTRQANISKIGGRLILDVESAEGGHIFLGPFGSGPIRPALEFLLENTANFEEPKVLRYVPKALADEIKQEFGIIREEKHRDFFDYIYLKSDLADLPGRKFQKRRNQVNKIKRIYKPEVNLITPDDYEQVLCCLNRWYEEFGSDDSFLEMERKSVSRILYKLHELGAIGVKIEINDEVCAMSWAVPLTSDTWLVPIEKASKNIKGMYQYINWSLANVLPDNVKYLNREADLGIEGLRIAKTRYNPAFLEEKYTLWFE